METIELEIEVATKPRFDIVEMRSSDIDAVAAVERRCNTLPWNPNAYSTELGNTNAYYVVAKGSAGEVVGFGGIWVIIDELHITTIAVDPALRGLRIGEQMFNAMIYEGIQRGATRATLEVRESNRVAQALYHKYGFVDVAQRKAYYTDNRENAIIMWAEEMVSPAYQQMLYGYRQRLMD